VLLFFIIPKYNIIFSGSQTRAHIGLYILISLIDRRAWFERGGGVTCPIFLYHPFPLLFVTYTYIPIFGYLDIRIPYPICLHVGHTNKPVGLIIHLSPYHLLFSLPVSPTGFTYLFCLPVLPYRYTLVLPTRYAYLFSLLDSPIIEEFLHTHSP